MGGICSCGKSSQVEDPVAGGSSTTHRSGREQAAAPESRENQAPNPFDVVRAGSGVAVDLSTDDDLFTDGETRARRRAMADKIKSASQRRLEGLGDEETDKAMELESVMENMGRPPVAGKRNKRQFSVKKMGSTRSLRSDGISGSDEESSGEDDESDEEEEEEDDDDAIFPVFDRGPRVKLRSVSRGRKRRQRYDLTSGYQLARIRERVNVDMAWTANDQSHRKQQHDHVPAHPRAPAWKTVILYFSSTLEADDTVSERGLLSRVTFPELQVRFADRMVNLVIADPRLCVRREPESPAEAADVVACLEASMATADGFVMVALRGSRYGWTPQASELKDSELPPEWPAGESMQAAEIKLALLYAREKAKVLVYFRRSDEPEEADAVQLEAECKELARRAKEEEAAAAAAESAALLKLEEYEDLDPLGMAQGGGDRFKDELAKQAFCDLIKRDVEAAVEGWLGAWELPERGVSEMEHRQAQRAAEERHAAVVAGGRAKFQTNETCYRRPNVREEVARECGQRRVEEECARFIPNARTVHALFSAVREQQQHVYVTGPVGSGKTAVLAWCTKRFQALAEEGWIVLSHFAGCGESWESVRVMLRRFCGELCQHMRVHAPVEDGWHELVAQFQELLTKATRLYDASVLVVVDGYDQMEGTEVLSTQAWLPDNEILGLTVVLSMEGGSACHRQASTRIRRHAHVQVLPLEEAQLHALAGARLRALLPGYEEEDLPAGLLAATAALGDRTTLWLVSACHVLATLAELYAKSAWPAAAMVRRGAAARADKVLVPGSAVHQRLVELVEQWADTVADVAAVLDPLVKVLEAELGSDSLRDFVCLLAVDDGGVREPDMLALLGYAEAEEWEGGSDDARSHALSSVAGRSELGEAEARHALTQMGEIIEEEEEEEEDDDDDGASMHSGASGGSARRYFAKHARPSTRPAEAEAEAEAEAVVAGGANFGEAAGEGWEGEGELEGSRLEVVVVSEEPGMRFVTFQRVRRSLRHLLQPLDQTDPALLRLRDRDVARVLKERFIPDEEVRSVVHHHMADYLCVVAGGEWTEDGGMTFSSRTLAQLRLHRRSVRLLPRHLMLARAWTDCVQLLCDLWFLRARTELRLTELHIEDAQRLWALIDKELPAWEGHEMGTQLRALSGRMEEMVAFLRADKLHLVHMPFTTTQQAANQPAESAPEIEGAAQLTSEVPGKVRYGRRSEQALAAEKVLRAARRGLQRYSPVRTMEAAEGTSSAGGGGVETGSVFGMSALGGVEGHDDLGGGGGGEMMTLLEEAEEEEAAIEEVVRRTASVAGLLTRVGSQLSVVPGEREEAELDVTQQHTVAGRPVCWLEVLNKREVAEQSARLGPAMAFKQVALSDDEVPRCGESLVCVAGAGGCVRVYDAATMNEIYEFTGHSQAVNQCSFDSQSELLATASDDGSLRVWEMPEYDSINRKVTGKGRCVMVLRGTAQGNALGHSDCVTQCEFAPDSRCLLSASDDTTIKTWNHRSGIVLRTLRGHLGWVASIRCSPTASLLLTGADNGVVRVWDIAVTPHATDKAGVQGGGLVWEQQGHKSPITVVEWARDGRHMATASEDCVVLVWRVGARRPLARFQVPAAPHGMSFDTEAWRLWLLLDDAQPLLYVCDIAPNARPLACLPLHKAIGGRAVAVLPQAGNTCVCAAGDGVVTRVRLHNAAHLEPPPPSPRKPKQPGVIRVADDEDDTEELEWEEFSGPLCVRLERVGGADGRVAVKYTTHGTNDDDPDFAPVVGVVEWEDGDAADKEVWIGMASFNGVEWDALASVLHIEPSTGLQERVEAKLAAFGEIEHVQGRVARTRPWHPPLAARADYRLMLDEVRDAERELNASEGGGGAEHAEMRLALADAELRRVQCGGSDADVGLSDWTHLGGKVAVVDLSLYVSLEGLYDPEEALRALSEVGLAMAKRAQAAGATGVVLVSCEEEAVVLKLKDVDCFDETTGVWDRAALAAAHVEIPVVLVGKSAGAPARMREGTVCQIVPQASNQRFWQQRGVRPKIELEMKGDTEFEVVLFEPAGTQLDAARARAKVRIVSKAEMERRNQQIKDTANLVKAEADSKAARAAEAVASKERREADAAEAAFAKEEQEARVAELRLEELTVESTSLQAQLQHKEEQVKAQDSMVEELEQRANNAKAVVKGMLGLVRKLEESRHLAEADKKALRKEEKARQKAALEEAVERYQQAKAALEADVRAIQSKSEASDALWLEVDELQRRCDEAMVAVVEQEALYRRERAEADLARMVRDKEVAEAEEAERVFAVERERAEEARKVLEEQQRRAAEEEAAQRREEEEMRRRVQEAAEELAAAAAREKEKEHEGERRRAEVLRAAEERKAARAAEELEKLAVEAERVAKQHEEAQAAWEAMEAERQLELKRQADKLAQRARLLDSGEGMASEYPWRRTRHALEAGHCRNSRPKLAVDFLAVDREWEGEELKGSNQLGLLDRVGDVAHTLPAHLRRPALQLASQDFLQALSTWGAVNPTEVLDGGQLKLSGRAEYDEERELAWPAGGAAGPGGDAGEVDSSAMCASFHQDSIASVAASMSGAVTASGALHSIGPGSVPQTPSMRPTTGASFASSAGMASSRLHSHSPAELRLGTGMSERLGTGAGTPGGERPPGRSPSQSIPPSPQLASTRSVRRPSHSDQPGGYLGSSHAGNPFPQPKF